MNVCGIIAEYNPFHSGHAWQIARARAESGSDYVIVVMSGDFVQRGAPALLDKYTRARMALCCGADLVLMLPVYGSTASAEGFARAGISALLTTGVVNAISFGCEDVSVCSDDYRRLARQLSHEKPDFQAALTVSLSTGIPYAQARLNAVRSCFGKDLDLSLLDAPNNLLAFEYMRALEYFDTALQLVPVRRRGSYHDTACQESEPLSVADIADTEVLTDTNSDSTSDTSFASAAACRQALLTDFQAALPLFEQSGQIPTEACKMLADYAAGYDFLQENNLSAALHYALLAQKDNGYEAFADCGRDLSARIRRHLDAFTQFSPFCDLLKNKSMTRARIARALTHILLQLPAQMPAPLASNDGTLPYLRVLGFRQSAAPLLHEIKRRARAPFITRVVEAERTLPGESLPYFKQDLLASDIYRSVLLQKCGRCYPDDYRRKIEII